MSRIRSIGIIIVDSVELHEGSLRASAYVGAKAHPAKIVHYYYHIDDYPVECLVCRASPAWAEGHIMRLLPRVLSSI